MKARFRFGKLLISPEAKNKLGRKDVVHALRRHLCGDWGDLTGAEICNNEFLLKNRGMVVSRYFTTDGNKFMILTKGDRSATIVFTPCKLSFGEVWGTELKLNELREASCSANFAEKILHVSEELKQ